jgi:hypothetical protein
VIVIISFFIFFSLGLNYSWTFLSVRVAAKAFVTSRTPCREPTEARSKLNGAATHKYLKIAWTSSFASLFCEPKGIFTEYDKSAPPGHGAPRDMRRILVECR